MFIVPVIKNWHQSVITTKLVDQRQEMPQKETRKPFQNVRFKVIDCTRTFFMPIFVYIEIQKVKTLQTDTFEVVEEKPNQHVNSALCKI